VRILAVLVLMLSTGPAVPFTGETVSNASGKEAAALVEWARSRYQLIDLDLPDVKVLFHDVTAPCNGANGIYRSGHGHPRIHICVRDRGTFASDLWRRRTLLHELAHAWEQANLDDADRARLLIVIDAADWYAPDAPWEERGAERFAETLVWGLYDQLRRPTLIDVACRELHADFLAITGFTAPGPVERICELDGGRSEAVGRR